MAWEVASPEVLSLIDISSFWVRQFSTPRLTTARQNIDALGAQRDWCVQSRVEEKVAFRGASNNPYRNSASGID